MNEFPACAPDDHLSAETCLTLKCDWISLQTRVIMLKAIKGEYADHIYGR